jgi:hypothetical protein
MPPAKYRYRVPHTGFAVGFCAALYVACNALNIDRLAKWFRSGAALDLAALSAYLAAGL